MIRVLVFDFGRVFVFPRDESYFGGLNDLHRVLSESPNYDFDSTFVLNNELLSFIKEKQLNLKYRLYLFTKGRIHRSSQSSTFLDGYFRDVFTCEKLKVEKNKPETYAAIAAKIGVDPSDILYIDDSRENTEAAEIAGASSITFRNNMQFETELEGYI